MFIRKSLIITICKDITNKNTGNANIKLLSSGVEKNRTILESFIGNKEKKIKISELVYEH